MSDDLLVPYEGPPGPEVMSREDLARVMEQMAGHSDGGWARGLRRTARVLRGGATVARVVALPLPRVTPRARERREQHVAEATSSADSGDPHLAGQAVCPVCSDLDLVRHLCRFCGGAGHVDR